MSESSETEPGARAAVERRQDQPADELTGVLPWLRPLAWGASTAFIVLVPLLINAVVSSPSAAMIAMLAAVMLAAFGAAWFTAEGRLFPAHIEVGTDGVSVSWMGMRWYYPFEGMEIAIGVGGGPDETRNNRFPNEAVQLTYEDGRRVKLGATHQSHAGLVNCINRRLDEYRAADRASPRASAVETLQRSEQTPEQWLAALKKQPVDGYRTDLTRQQLLAVLQDPSAAATARAAAAKLLRTRVEDRPLIRVVAEQTAQPKMRIALQTAASDEEEARVDEALACVVDEAR